jgi:hypothetical protein
MMVFWIGLLTRPATSNAQIADLDSTSYLLLIAPWLMETGAAHVRSTLHHRHADSSERGSRDRLCVP